MLGKLRKVRIGGKNGGFEGIRLFIGFFRILPTTIFREFERKNFSVDQKGLSNDHCTENNEQYAQYQQLLDQ